MKKKIIIILVVIILVIQFIPVNKTNPKADPLKDYFTLTSPSEEVKNIIKVSCFDCHSSETAFPWYSNVAPISWFLINHINEGRENLNFSEWGNYDSKKQNNLMEDIAEVINEDEMPPNSYTLMHSEAKLNENKKALLIKWFSNNEIENKKEED